MQIAWFLHALNFSYTHLNMAQQGIQSLKDLTGGKTFFIFFVVPTFLGYLGFQSSNETKCNLHISIFQSNSFLEQNSKNYNQFSFHCLTLFHTYQSQQPIAKHMESHLQWPSMFACQWLCCARQCCWHANTLGRLRRKQMYQPFLDFLNSLMSRVVFSWYI